MTSITSLGSASTAWPAPSASRANAMKEHLFNKVDADHSGSVDATELQGMLDHVAKKTGQAAGNADEMLTKFDSNGDGSLGMDELDAGMKSLMPPPASTVDFAQQHGPGGPPPGAAPEAAASSTSSTSSSAATDPLDTNGDGVVSAQEQMAGDLQALMQSMDTDSSGSISADELHSFVSQLASASAQTYSRAADNFASTAQVDVAA